MRKIIVGMGTCGLSAGAREVHHTIAELLAQGAAGPQGAELSITSCLGMCYREPMVEVREDGGRIIYGEVNPDRARAIVEKHLKGGQVITEWVVYSEDAAGNMGGSEKDFLALQKRIVLRNCGVINPESLEDYEAVGGYRALRQALFEMTPDGIIAEVKASGLRGRGGAGFPTGQKWSFAAANAGPVKYVVCNADEGDPGAFMDRSVLEGDPHSVLEGMIICGRAIGSSFGYIYCRAEYPLAIKRLNTAIADARRKGYLGQDILGSGHDFDIKIKQGAGAFVCGEETALFASIEGERGMPRLRPPFPAEKGLWQKPTNNNNVETYANISWILVNGAPAYAAFGTEKSRGTKVFALAGSVNRGGLAEVPMGTSINQLVFGIGGGIKGGRKFKGVQMGGPSGGCIPHHLGETPVDFENIPKTGAIMGSGGMIVMDDSTCMVDIARFFLNFTQDESCGKCTFCRIGTLRMLEILERITRGEGAPADVAKLQSLSAQIKEASLCGLGQTAPNPVLTTLRYFMDECLEHINHKKCPAKSCALLVVYRIDPAKCTGCTLCARNCASNAIRGKVKELHVVDDALCIKCGKCITSCTFGAVYKD